MHYTHIILRLPAVLKVTGVSRSLIYQQISDGLWPKPIRISNRSVGWLKTEVEALVKARVANLDSESIKKLVANLIENRALATPIAPQKDELHG
jgi:prophage regulatory protein